MKLPTRPVLTIEAAKEVAEAAKAAAHAKGFEALIVAIVDPGGHLLYLERMDRIPPGTVQVALLKARSAAHFESPSKNFEDAVGEGLFGLVGLPDMAAFEGAAPIMHEGWLVGAIAVSGLTKELDGEFARAGADALPAILARG
jgi:glc operon protein GlcG